MQLGIYTNDPVQRGGIEHLNRCLIQSLPKYVRPSIYSYSSIRHFLFNKKIRTTQFENKTERTIALNFFRRPLTLSGFRNIQHWWSTIGSPAFLPNSINPNVIWMATLIKDELKKGALSLNRLNKIEYEAIKNCPSVYTISPFTTQRVQEELGIETKTLLPPLDDNVFLQRKKSLSDDHEGIRYVAAARFNDPRKNLDLIVDAFKLVKEPNDHLTIIGATKFIHDPQITYLYRLSRKDYINELLKNDVFILGSKSEGLGIAALEASALGIWLASTPCGGIEAFINNRGLLSNKISILSLANTLNDIKSVCRETLPEQLPENFTGTFFTNKIHSIIERDFNAQQK